MKQQHFAKSQECMRLNVVVVSKWPECFQFLTFEQGLFCVWAQFPGSLTILCVQKFIRSIEGAYLHGMWRYIGSYLANKGEKGRKSLRRHKKSQSGRKRAEATRSSFHQCDTKYIADRRRRMKNDAAATGEIYHVKPLARAYADTFFSPPGVKCAKP